MKSDMFSPDPNNITDLIMGARKKEMIFPVIKNILFSLASSSQPVIL